MPLYTFCTILLCILKTSFTIFKRDTSLYVMDFRWNELENLLILLFNRFDADSDS